MKPHAFNLLCFAVFLFALFCALCGCGAPLVRPHPLPPGRRDAILSQLRTNDEAARGVVFFPR